MPRSEGMSLWTHNYQVMYWFVHHFFLKIKVYLCEDSAKKNHLQLKKCEHETSLEEENRGSNLKAEEGYKKKAGIILLILVIFSSYVLRY